MVLRWYKKNIAEGLGFVIFSILFAVIVRVVSFLTISDLSIYNTNTLNGYLWAPIAPLFNNPFVCLAGSTLCLVLIVIMLAYINTKYVLIRRKTSLHIAICILLFSGHPGMICMSSSYIGVLFALAAISRMFGSYSTNKKSRASLEVNFILALGSLFAPNLLLFLPAFWLGLGMMRSFNFRAFLASLFSVLCVYFPAYTYFLFTNQEEAFLHPFQIASEVIFARLPIVDFEYADWIILSFIVFVLAIVFIYNYMTNYKDKIRVRALISSLNLIVLFSLIVILFVNVNTDSSLYILLAVGTLLMTHFFALAEERWIAYLFYLSIVVYIASVSLTFSPLT